MTDLKRIACLKDYQCLDCWSLIYWFVNKDEDKVVGSCDCEDGDRTYVLKREDIPYLEAATCL